MSVSNEIDRIKSNISAAYTKITGRGGTAPSVRNSANLASAIDTIPRGTDTSDATATANDLMFPETAYVKGQKITGNIRDMPGANILPSTEWQVAVPAHYCPSSDVVVEGDDNLVSGNIKSGVSIFGVEGTLETGGSTTEPLYSLTITNSVTGSAVTARRYVYYRDNSGEHSELVYAGDSITISVISGLVYIGRTTISHTSGTPIVAKVDNYTTVLHVAGDGEYTVTR